MKKFFSLFLCLAFVSTSLILAETPQGQEAAQISVQEEKTPTPPKEVGKASADGLRAAKKRDWQNWLFAGTSVAAAIVALLLLRDSGHAPHHHQN